MAADSGQIAGWAGGSGPPLLLLHGGPAVSDYMDALDAQVAGWRAIRYQQRSLPPSATSGPFTIERHVADAVAVLDEMGAGRAVVLGHSWGGHLALHLAVAHPDRVTGLVIVDGLGVIGDGGAGALGSNLVSRLSGEARSRYAAVTARLAGPGATDDDALAALTILWPGYYADPAAAPPIPPRMRSCLAGNMETIASARAHLAAGFAETLRGVHASAVLVLGAASPMPVSQGTRTAAMLPDAEVNVVPAAGHLPWHEAPGCIAAALARIRARTA